MDNSYKRKGNYHRGGGSFNNWNNSKKKFRNYLAPGMKGFICTCNFREKDCVKESYNILNEYADQIFGSDEPCSAVETEAGSEGGGGDIEEQLEREVRSLKTAPRALDRFVAVDTGVRSNIFIKTTLDDPVKLAYSILNEVAETKVQKARFVMRIVPVEITCKANLEDIKTAADTIIEKHFACEPTTFAVVVNKRYNDSVLRDEVIHALALLVTDRNKEHKANLKEAKKTVLVEIMKGVCCLSVLEDYKRLRHYNLAELTKPETDKTEVAETDKPEDTEAGEDSGNEEDETEIKESQKNKDVGNTDEAKPVEQQEEKSSVVGTGETSSKPDETPTGTEETPCKPDETPT